MNFSSSSSPRLTSPPPPQPPARTEAIALPTLPDHAALSPTASEKSKPPPYHTIMAISLADDGESHVSPPSYNAATSDRANPPAHHWIYYLRNGRFAFYGCCCCLLFLVLFVLLFVAVLPRLNKI